MIIKSKKKSSCNHDHSAELSRRELLGASITSILFPTAFLNGMVSAKAIADNTCGGTNYTQIGHAMVSWDQGPFWNMFAPIISDSGAIADATTLGTFSGKWGVSTAANYSSAIKGVPLNATDPFAQALLNGFAPSLIPPAYWQAKVLGDASSACFHVATNDDGGEEVTPQHHLGLIAKLKSAEIASNFNVGNNLTPVDFAKQYPDLSLSATVAAYSAAVTYPGSNLTSQSLMQISAQGAQQVGSILAPLRAGKFRAEQIGQNFACTFGSADKAADPNRGTLLFDITQASFVQFINQALGLPTTFNGVSIPAITSAQLGALTDQIKSSIMGAYQNSNGVITSMSCRSGTGDEHAAQNNGRAARRTAAGTLYAALIFGGWLSGKPFILDSNGAGSAGGGTVGADGNGNTIALNGNDNGNETTVFHTLVVLRNSGGVPLRSLGFRNPTTGSVSRTGALQASTKMLAIARAGLFASFMGSDMLAQVATLGRQAGVLTNESDLNLVLPRVG